MIYNNTISDTEFAVSESDLEHIQNRFGFIFPREFWVHYLEYNGGSPDKYVYNYQDRLLIVQELLPIRHGTKNCLFEDTYYDLKIERMVIPEHLVPFAIDPGGDYFCFSLQDDDIGAIYFFIGEYAESPERAIIRLASSLKEFIDSLIEEG
jgi:hypothetical protein